MCFCSLKSFVLKDCITRNSKLEFKRKPQPHPNNCLYPLKLHANNTVDYCGISVLSAVIEIFNAPIR